MAKKVRVRQRGGPLRRLQGRGGEARWKEERGEVVPNLGERTLVPREKNRSHVGLLAVMNCSRSLDLWIAKELGWTRAYGPAGN